MEGDAICFGNEGSIEATGFTFEGASTLIAGSMTVLGLLLY